MQTWILVLSISNADVLLMSQFSDTISVHPDQAERMPGSITSGMAGPSGMQHHDFRAPILQSTAPNGDGEGIEPFRPQPRLVEIGLSMRVPLDKVWTRNSNRMDEGAEPTHHRVSALCECRMSGVML